MTTKRKKKTSEKTKEKKKCNEAKRSFVQSQRTAVVSIYRTSYCERAITAFAHPFHGAESRSPATLYPIFPHTTFSYKPAWHGDILQVLSCCGSVQLLYADDRCDDARSRFLAGLAGGSAAHYNVVRIGGCFRCGGRGCCKAD